MLAKPRINPNSNAYFIQKFTKEIVRAWQALPTLPDEHSQLKL